MESDLRPAMQQSADLVLETQRALIPRDTGASWWALTAFVSKSGLNAQIGIRGKENNKRFFYLRFVEYGTKGGPGKAGAEPTNKADGENFFGYAPDIPARPAHPWLRPSIDMNRDEIRVIISRAISSTLKRAAQGVKSG
nr:HK97 gp10 family phage protein [Pseudomonas sp. KSR10]